MEHLSFSEIRTHLAQALQRIETTGQSIAITKHGKPCAVIEPYETRKTSFIGALSIWRSEYAENNIDEDFEPRRVKETGRDFSW